MKKRVLSFLTFFVLVSTFAFTPAVNAQQAATPIASVSFATSLKYGSRGDAVMELEDFLTDQGVYTGKLDGRFGFGLLRAVKAFQTANSLSADGYFGKASRAKANEILATELSASDAAEQEETGTISAPVVQPKSPTPINVTITNPTPAPTTTTNMPTQVSSMKDLKIENLTQGDVIAGKDCFKFKVTPFDDNGDEVANSYPMQMVSSEWPNQKVNFGGGGDKNLVNYCPSNAGDLTLTFSFKNLQLTKTSVVTVKPSAN